MKAGSKGSVTIEATISLTAFMFAIVTLLITVNICVAQAKIAVAINTTAREISQYSYLYGLTGFNQQKRDLANASKPAKDEIGDTLTNINKAYDAMQSIGDSTQKTDIANPSTYADAFGAATTGASEIGSSVDGISTTVQNIAGDPKAFIFSMIKMAASETIDYATTKLIAEPLARTMVQKHFQDYSGQSAEDYLKSIGVVPGPSGLYLDGLDFSKSSLYLYGSDDIRIVVTYKIKLIQLLPLRNIFTFTQTAATKGWLLGDEVESKSESEAISEDLQSNNESYWINTPIQRRVEAIREKELEKLKNDGYLGISSMTQVHAFNPADNNFVFISTTNPLYSEGSTVMTVADLDEAQVRETYKRVIGQISSDLDGIKEVTVKTGENGKQTYDLTKKGVTVTKTVRLVIPEDPGLKEKMQSILDTYDTGGVTIELVQGYGSGVDTVSAS